MNGISFKNFAHWQDMCLAVGLGLCLGVLSHHLACQVPQVVYKGSHNDLWFESDSPRIYKNLTDHDSDYSRGKVHPLFALVAFGPVYAFKKTLPIDAAEAVRLVTSVVAFAWAVVLFSMFRLITIRRIDAFLLTLLGSLSAAAMFFFTLPETYPFGSLSLLLAFLIAVISQHAFFAPWLFVLVNVATISITTTNWMAGLLVTIINHPFKKFITIVLLTVGVTLCCWQVQKMMFPTSGNFLRVEKESAFILRPEAGSPMNAVRSVFYHSLIMPTITSAQDPEVPDWTGMVTQHSPAGSATVWGRLAVGLWSLLLLAGLWGMFTVPGFFKLRFVLGLTLLGQLLLHLVYGFETFLYSLHFIAVLIPVAAFSALTKFRNIVTVVLIILVPCVYINNSIQFSKAVAFIEEHYPTDLNHR